VSNLNANNYAGAGLQTALIVEEIMTLLDQNGTQYYETLSFFNGYFSGLNLTGPSSAFSSCIDNTTATFINQILLKFGSFTQDGRSFYHQIMHYINSSSGHQLIESLQETFACLSASPDAASLKAVLGVNPFTTDFVNSAEGCLNVSDGNKMAAMWSYPLLSIAQNAFIPG
jgi:hypothetical protein